MEEKRILELDKKIKGDYGNIAGIVVLRDGALLYENYFNGCNAQSRIHVYSVTKSILSVLIGIAVDRGCIQSVEQKVLDFFPDHAFSDGGEKIRDITVENLLTMTAPFRYRFFAPYVKYFKSDDWVSFTLDLLGGAKTGRFRYTPLIGPDILSGILTRAAGCGVLAFAKENLFRPLGITVERNVCFQSKEEQLAFNSAKDISGWVCDPAGVNSGGWGLTLSAADMAKIGQLFLDGGVWKGRRIVSERWLAESTREHSRWEKAGLSYGYLWWIIDQEDQACAAMGDGGNVIYFNRTKGMVVSIASFYAKKAGDRIQFIRDCILPVFD